MNTDKAQSTPSPTTHVTLAFVRDLLTLPGSHVNLERSGGRRRLRFKITDPATGRVVRKAVELPDDDELAATLANALHAHRQARREARNATPGRIPHGERQWRKSARKRLCDACPHGKTAKRRLSLVFDLAADLGPGFLEDFIGRRPWLAKSPWRAGRRPKRG